VSGNHVNLILMQPCLFVNTTALYGDVVSSDWSALWDVRYLISSCSGWLRWLG